MYEYYGWQIMLMIVSVILAFIIVILAILFLLYIIGKRIYKQWKKRK